MLNPLAPPRLKYPIAPEKRLRRFGSSSSMIYIARIFGAPVIEPPGKTARTTSIGPSPGRMFPTTVAIR